MLEHGGGETDTTRRKSGENRDQAHLLKNECVFVGGGGIERIEGDKNHRSAKHDTWQAKKNAADNQPETLVFDSDHLQGFKSSWDLIKRCNYLIHSFFGFSAPEGGERGEREEKQCRFSPA